MLTNLHHKTELPTEMLNTASDLALILQYDIENSGSITEVLYQFGV